MPSKAAEQFDKKFNMMSKELRTLMKQMLCLSPCERLSAKELIKAPYFNSIRNKEQEDDADFQVKVTVDEDLTFDYETFEDSLSVNQYLKLIQGELTVFKKTIWYL